VRGQQASPAISAGNAATDRHGAQARQRPGRVQLPPAEAGAGLLAPMQALKPTPCIGLQLRKAAAFTAARSMLTKLRVCIDAIVVLQVLLHFLKFVIGK